MLTHIALTHRSGTANEITVFLMSAATPVRPSITDRFQAVRKGEATEITLSLN